MKVTVELTDTSTKFIINNIYPLYLHDLSGIWGWKPNRYGIYEDDDTRTLNDQIQVFDIWWEKPSILFPYLIRVDGLPAGFALVATPPHTFGSDYYMNEFFVMKPFRGKHVAENAASQVFDKHAGSWEVQTNATDRNKRAQTFWRKTLQNYVPESCVKELVATRDDNEKLIFQFNSSLA
ncbi:GNAT family N-acetyltransferase [Paenibacillus lautus]|uniref:GNAT family N-acetyltransferase n=1 Tax=Paenibacillus lautus TaxID=1401 RepID=UPI000FD79716|nr:GNAT family N-acetyltransferase [Paenibacillus lautus]